MGRASGLLFSLVAVNAAYSATPIRVCEQGCAHSSIREAVRQAPAGSRIEVAPGTYRESGIRLERKLELVGLKGSDGSLPVIDGGLHGNLIEITATGAGIHGFELRNSGQSYIEDLAGIRVVGVEGCAISGNRLVGNFFGIHVEKSSGCRIQDNRIQGTGRNESASGNGIHVWNGERMIIEGNEITGHRDGIYFEFVKDSRIERNRSHDNLRYGLHFIFSDRDSYQGNVFSRNASGVAVMYSKNIDMRENRFESSFGGAAYGALLKDISGSRIESNRFSGNTVGAYLEGTTRSRFEGNRFESNGWAIRVLGDCDSNEFTGNDFVANTFDVSTNSASGTQNRFDRNYWSAYRGLDTDRDGAGDSPYRPVRLSSAIIERFGASILLLRSLFLTIADEAESLLPVLTPDGLMDRHPLMQAVHGSHGSGK